MNFYRDQSNLITGSPLTDKVIVLDLDETLVHTHSDMDRLRSLRIMTDPRLMDIRNRTYVINLDDVNQRRGTGNVTQLWGITRPYIKEFLTFCFNHFKIVAVWSAGEYKYVHAIVENIFKDIAPPHIVYTRDDCFKDDYGGLLKPLSKMIENEIDLNKYMSLNNTLIIDDRPSTFSFNPDNGVMIPLFEPSGNINSLRRPDNSLLQLMNWLDQELFIKCRDVRTLDKGSIFTEQYNDPNNFISSPYDIQTSGSMISDHLLSRQNQNNNTTISPSPFLPKGCYDSKSGIVCDPKLVPMDLLDSPGDYRVQISHINSPLASLSPKRFVSSVSPPRNGNLSPINKISTPRTPQPIFMIPQSPTNSPLSLSNINTSYVPRSFDRRMSRVLDEVEVPKPLGFEVHGDTTRGPVSNQSKNRSVFRAPSNQIPLPPVTENIEKDTSILDSINEDLEDKAYFTSNYSSYRSPNNKTITSPISDSFRPSLYNQYD